MKYKRQGNCPYCDSERGILTYWGMSPEGFASLKERHNEGHPENQPTQNQCCCTKCPRDCQICIVCNPANSMQKPQNPTQEDWEKELEERFMAFHFEFDERQEHDKSTAELRDWTKSFIRQLLASQKIQLTKEMADAIEMSKQGWIEQGEYQIRKRVEEEIIKLLKEFSNTSLGKRENGWNWLLKLKSKLKEL